MTAWIKKYGARSIEHETWTMEHEVMEHDLMEHGKWSFNNDA